MAAAAAGARRSSSRMMARGLTGDALVTFRRRALDDSLRAVLLVVDDISKGPLLMFRYPACAPSLLPDKSDNYTDEFFVRLFVPKPALCDQALEVEIDGITFVSYPVALPPGASAEIRFFNIVFVLDLSLSRGDGPAGATVGAGGSAKAARKPAAGAGARACAGAGSGARHTAAMYQGVATRLAHALVHEEGRCGYVSREVTAMLALREELFRLGPAALADAAGSQAGAAARASAAASQAGRRVSVMHPAFVNMALARSSLARELRQVFDSLATTSAVHVRLNNWVLLSTSLADAWAQQYAAHSRPYHTLLLLDEPEQLLAQLSPDASPQVRQLIKLASPLKSFQDMQVESGVPLNQILRLAAHLLYWQRAQVMTYITKNSTFKISPTAPLSPSDPVAVEFGSAFPQQSFAKCMATFSEPKRFYRHMQGLSSADQREFIMMVVWLLRRQCLIQLYTYVYVITPGASDGSKAGDGDSFRGADQTAAGRGSGAVDTDGAGAGADSPVARLMRHVRANVEATPDAYRLLARLLPYCNGRFPLEEIMWRERIGRTRLRELLAQFQSVLCCCQHESVVHV